MQSYYDNVDETDNDFNKQCCIMIHSEASTSDIRRYDSFSKIHNVDWVIATALTN